jgi:rubrerythrin
MSSGLNHKRFSNCNAVDMSSSAITSRLREVSQLHQLGLSLANAKPMVTLPRSVDKTDAMPLKVQADSVSNAFAVTADSYNDEQALRAYILKHFRHLMTPLERRTVEYASPIVRSSDHWKIRRLYDFLEERDGHVSDEEVMEAFKIAHAQRMDHATDRLLTNSPDSLFINRCPKCDRIAKTPEAKQCLWCGHDWH